VSALIQGGYLSLWGVAMLLCWVSTLRLIHIAHCAAARHGWVREPRHAMAPITAWSELSTTSVALACGNAGLIAFAGIAVTQLRIPDWLVPHDLVPWLQVLRIVLALVVMIYFLTRVDEHPRFKLAWAACWCAFSFVLVSLA
jgi:hypothetical protein